MNEKDNIQKELEELNSGLGKYQKDKPFDVPAGYFKTLPDEILKKTFRRKLLFPGISTAKLVLRTSLFLTALMLIAYLVIIPLKNNIENKTLYSGLENYLIDNIDEATMVEFYQEGQIQGSEYNTLDEYIIENLDENSLMNEL